MSESNNTTALLEAIKKLSPEERCELIESLNKPEPEPEMTETDKLRQELVNTRNEIAHLKHRIDSMDRMDSMNCMNHMESSIPMEVELESCCPFSFDISSFIKWVLIIVMLISVIQTISKISKISGDGVFRPCPFPI